MPSTNSARLREKTVARQSMSRDFSSGLPITFEQRHGVNLFQLFFSQMQSLPCIHCKTHCMQHIKCMHSRKVLKEEDPSKLNI